MPKQTYEWFEAAKEARPSDGSLKVDYLSVCEWLAMQCSNLDFENAELRQQLENARKEVVSVE